MRVGSIRIAAIVATLVGSAAVSAGAALATPGPGTYTRITTPSHNVLMTVRGAPGAHTHLTVAGRTSNDVTTVDIYCMLYSLGSAEAQKLAAAVPVTGGSFSTTIDFAGGSALPNCRMRAVPDGVDASTAYLGSYRGPILYMNTMMQAQASGTLYGVTAVGEQGDGIGEFSDAGECGSAVLATVELPSMTVRGPGMQACFFVLPQGNQTSSGTATASSIKVSGHNAYLPSAVHSYLIGTQAISTITQPKLTATFHAADNGDVTVTESAVLRRCSVSDTYPPTSVSCPHLVSTGVKFVRVTNIFRGAHQIRFRDSFVSTDGHQHAITLQYQGEPAAPPTGATGYTFPGHSSTFHTVTPDQVVTHLGTKAGTVFVRSDIRASSDEVVANTLGLTWSRAPSKVVFSHDAAADLAMPYALTVPAGGAAHLGFAISEHVLTKDTKALAAVAVGEMVRPPTISSPRNGATIHGHATTVKGTVRAGANGLPTSVKVNGHAAHLTTVSATEKAYTVTFDESFARHTITVTARDAAGNTRSRSITVRNEA